MSAEEPTRPVLKWFFSPDDVDQRLLALRRTEYHPLGSGSRCARRGTSACSWRARIWRRDRWSTPGRAARHRGRVGGQAVHRAAAGGRTLDLPAPEEGQVVMTAMRPCPGSDVQARQAPTRGAWCYGTGRQRAVASLRCRTNHCLRGADRRRRRGSADRCGPLRGAVGEDLLRRPPAAAGDLGLDVTAAQRDGAGSRRRCLGRHSRGTARCAPPRRYPAPPAWPGRRAVFR